MGKGSSGGIGAKSVAGYKGTAVSRVKAKGGGARAQSNARTRTQQAAALFNTMSGRTTQGTARAIGARRGAATRAANRAAPRRGRRSASNLR